MVHGHLEPLTALLRIGGAYGEPYTWAATVRYLSPSSVEIVGAMRAPTPSEWRAMRVILKASGVASVLFVRHKGDALSTHRWTL